MWASAVAKEQVLSPQLSCTRRRITRKHPNLEEKHWHADTGRERYLVSHRPVLLARLAYASYPLLIEARNQVGSDLCLIFEHKMA
jgi:hypothetical protein